MAPKKAATQAPKPKVEVPQCGLMVESSALPLWDDGENDKEQWGELTAAHVDPSQHYVDPDTPSPPVAAFAGVAGLDWRRPGGVFSPFKPVVVRPTVSGNPYEYVPPAATAEGATGTDDDDDMPQPQTRSEMIAMYRTMKAFRAVGADDDTSPSRRGGQAAGGASKRRDRAVAPTPFFMRAFNSALMVINQSQTLLPAGTYAWELIYPQGAGHLPLYNPNGKYAVKLYVGGAFRRVLIDDRLPTDGFGQCILTVTEAKEIWPALLAKAMLKVLGPQHESLLFSNPGFVVQTLMCGWHPQSINPRREEALAFRLVRNSVERMRNHRDFLAQQDAVATAAAAGQPTSPAGGSNPATPNASNRPAGAILMATCNDTSTLAPASSVAEEHAVAAGLHCTQAFYVMDMQPFQNTNLVRLCSPGAAWKGNFSYDSATWTAEVEEAIGFVPSRDRDSTDLGRRWNDFWIPWDSFVKFFSSLVNYRDAMARDCSVFRQITYLTDPPAPPADAAPAGGKKGQAQPTSTVPADNTPRTISRWVSTNSDSPTTLTFCITGTPQAPAARRASDAEGSSAAAPSGPLTTVVEVASYDWARCDPFTNVTKLSSSDGLTNSTTLRVGAGLRAFRITVRDVYNGVVVAVMGASEFNMGDQKDICRDVLGIHTITDAGVYSEHAAGKPTIWFKRLITTKQPCNAVFSISTLPKGTDITQHRQIPVEAPAGKGGKPDKAKGGAAGKGKAAADPKDQGDNVNDQIDDGPHEKPITSFVRLRVIDLDSGKAVDDVVGKVRPMELQPNKSGYILVARATTPEAFGKGYWRLECTSDRLFDSFEQRAFDDVQSLQGKYQQNDRDLLFRYNLTAGEAATSTVQLALGDGGSKVPVTVSLYHNDTLIEQRESLGGATIEHATFTPPEKGTPSVYALQCTVDKAFIARWAGERRQQVVANYRTETERQTAQLQARSQELLAMLEADPNAKLPDAADADTDDGAAAPPSAATTADSIGFTLSLHSSTAKIEVKEDASVNESTNAIKQSWSRKDDAPVPEKGAKAAKPGKGQPVDESATRFAKAKESRDRFLANRQGVFLPFVSSATGQVVKSLDEDPQGYRRAAPAPPAALEAPQRLHGGFARDGSNLVCGLEGTYGDAADGAAVPSSSPAKPDIKATIERLQTDVVAAMREERRAAAKAVDEVAAAFFMELKPDRPPTEPPAEDDKKKPGKKK